MFTASPLFGGLAKESKSKDLQLYVLILEYSQTWLGVMEIS